MAIDIVATVVPNVSKVDNDHYYFYVFLTPRISCSERQKLVNFRHIYNWTDYFCFFRDVENIQFRIYDELLAEIGETSIRGKEKIEVMVPGYRGDVKVLKKTGECSFKPDTLDEIWEYKGNRYKYAKLIWRSMFDFETPVDGWELDKEPFELAGKITPMEILSALREYISGYRHRLLNRSLSDLGIKIQSNSRFEEDAYKRELLGILDSLYSQDINGILNSPYLTNLRSPFKPFFEELRNELKRIKNSIDAERSELALKLELQDVEERNSTETKEFHKKMAAYGNFPYLLKQTGWIWEFKIKKEAFAGRGSEEDLFVSVSFGKKDIDFREREKNVGKKNHPLDSLVAKPNDTDKICSKCDTVEDCRCCETRKADFEDNINFLYPVTAIKMNGEFVDYRFQENGYLEIKNSIIQRPAKDPYSFIALLEDKNEQFEKIAELLRKDFSISAKDIYTEGKISSVMDTLTEERRQKLDVLVEQYKQVKKENSSASTLTDYSSSGISVYLKGILQSWETNRINSPLQNRELLTSNNKAGVAAVVFGHNLHKGYRPDVSRMIDGKPNDINSLCKRWVFYSIQLDRKKVNMEEFETVTMDPEEQEAWKASPERFNPFECCHLVDEDEGWVLESMQGSNSGKYYVDEELFRWNDWSLCANKLFKNDFKEDDGTAAFIKETSNLNIFSIPVPCSLPKLRYGNKYNFRLRFVDICGGGKTFDPADRPGDKERILTKDILYVRIQGLTSPLVYLSEELHEGGVRTADYLSHRIGEDVHTLVIRSHYYKDKNKEELVYDKNTKTSRYIGPAQLDFQLVKKHGCFDDMISPNGSPKNKTRRMIELTRGLKKPQAEDLTDTNEHILTQNGPINYLYDPLVNGYDFYLNKLHEDTLTFGQSNTYIDSTKELKYTKLNLKYDPKEAKGYDYKFIIDANTITVSLQQGMEKELEIDSTFKDNLRIDGSPVSTLDGILKNRKVLKSRSTLRLLHAVQKPCLLYAKHNSRYFNNAYENLEIPAGFTRELNNPAVKATFYFNEFPCLTSESYILHALYIEKTGCRSKKRRDGSDNTDGYDYIYANRIIKTGIKPDREGIEQAVYFSNIEHTFNDTRSRYVYYKMEAISKFKKYFPEKINDFSVFGRDGEESPVFTAEKEPGWKELNDTYNNNHKNRLAIPSSNQPPALVVDRIVPLIKWDGDINTGRARICDTIRIYFEGDWFTTGDDEQVALFYTNFKTAVDSEDITVNSSNVPMELVNAISELGNDPAAKNHGCDNIPAIDNRMLNRTDSGQRTVLIKNLDFENNGHPEYGKQEVTAALYDIKYMCPQGEELLGKYYIDIKIGEVNEKGRNFPKDFYFPFFRFAIARYQPHTIPPADMNVINPCFSKITLTDFVQLLPYRKLTLSGSKLTIDTIAKRESESEEKPMILPNIMQVIQGAKPENSLPEICEKAPEATLQPEKVIGDSIVFTFKEPIAGPFEIEEYEQYDSKMKVDEHTAFKNDFRKRLIFSYYQP